MKPRFVGFKVFKTRKAAVAQGRRIAKAFLAATTAIERLPKRERATAAMIVARFYDIELRE